MRYQIDHETTLKFETAVHEHHCELRVAPRTNAHQKVLNFKLETTPPADIFSYIDSFGNQVHHFSVLPPHQKLITRVTSEVDCLLENPFEYPLMMPTDEDGWLGRRFVEEPSLWHYVLHDSVATPTFRSIDWKNLAPPGRNAREPVQNAIINAMKWVGDTLVYRSGTTHAHSPLTEVLRDRSGVCQDFAHLFITLIRSWGIPARYVMGYLDPGVAPTEESENEAQATHAWVEVLIPGAGWRGFDATRQLVANHSYIRVAVGRDSLDAAPQRGTFKGHGGGQSPSVKLQIARQNQ